MTRKILFGGIAGGVALLVWTVIAWTLLPLYASVLKSLPAEAEVVDALVAAKTPRGFYVIPALPKVGGLSVEDRKRAEAAWEEKYRAGPVAYVVYEPRGRPLNRMFRPMTRGALLSVLAALFSAWALSRTRIAGFFARALFVLGLGFFSWLLGPAVQWNWLGYPPDYVLVALVDGLAGWAIVGVVQAGIVRPGRARPA